VSGEQKGAANHDVFSCAVTLYEALFGQRPNIQAVDAPSLFRPSLAPLDNILRTALGHVSSRFKTAAEFATALRESITRIEAAETLSAANPPAEKFRRKAIERREAVRQEQIRQAEAQKQLASEWTSLDGLVQTAARKAFADMLSAAPEVDSEYSFRELPEPNPVPNEPTPLCVLSSPRVHGICFGWSATNILTRPLGDVGNQEEAVPWPRHAPMASAPITPTPREILKPQWVIYTEGGRQIPARILHGAIAGAKSPTTGRFVLINAEHVRQYVTEVIGKCFGL
jgi:hypothetical protein